MDHIVLFHLLISKSCDFMHVILPNNTANFTDFRATQPNKNPGKYTNSDIYHEILKY